ncbi:hypothetical protein AAGC94_09185 [Clostridium sporogenes]|uniref:Ribose 5-phosphate isomerase n=2 Tax=Clostridium TaxID=1485 RepID=A0A7X5PC07_CLOSG|nr:MULTISPECIES: hypothetical protein [Clostridium]AJD30762.1 putative ribose 5-phosphate isomerase [Clostridium botulinum Prevot_594]AVP60835.1 hypothetical protein C7M79_09010 [Clostridium botulinum]EHN15609.1 hypothetical protein IYC_07650 [Clostridium sporogenes PA 3679]AKC60893.1 hypothetical protein CLSPO_c01560 [Clostridium sporogenes]AKJ88252.1 hypothetical protein CLSPOx_00780 [Clostridium sporogenes]
MNYFTSSKYENIIKLLCEYKGLSEYEMINIMRDNECRYLLFLLLRKYNCIEIENLRKDFNISDYEGICNNIEEAEKKLLLNKKIRDMFFEAGEILDNIK